MKTVYVCFALLVALWLPGTAKRQGSAPQTDSLERAIRGLPLPDQIKRYDDLSWQYMSSDIPRSVAFSKKGLALAAMAGDEKMEVTFYHTLGTTFYIGSEFDSAAFYLDMAKARLGQMTKEEPRMEAVLHVAYGDLYRAMSQYDQSLASHRQAITIFEELGDRATLGKAYKNMAVVYHLLRNSERALHYFKKAEEIALETDDMETLGSVSASLADLYLYIGEAREESVRYARKAVRIFGETGNHLARQMALLTLAKVYDHYGEYDAALPIAEQLVREAEAMNYPTLTTQSMNVLSNIYYHTGRYGESVELAKGVVQLDSANSNNMTNAYANLAQGYARLGRFDLMEEYFERYGETVTSYSNETYQKSLTEMEVKYESEIKTIQIETLERQRTLYTWLGIAGLLILLSTSAVAVIRSRLAVSRRKLAEQETRRLEQENQLIAVQAALEGEAAERSRLARDLHDGLGSMLSVVKLNLPRMDGGAVLESLDVVRFNKALGLLDESIQELRRVAHHMMPESLIRNGLKASLADFCRSLPHVKFHYFGEEQRLSDKLEMLVYRCIHELVINAVKHAQAKQINVQLVQVEDRISFTVQDDGIGFETEKVPAGMGLRNIRQRVASFQGEMSVYSSEKGTEIHVELDLNEK